MKHIVEEWITRWDMIPRGTKVLAAVSGGPDSMAAASILKSLQSKYEFTLGIAHVNHGFRPEASKEEARVVRTWSEDQQLPFFSSAMFMKESPEDKTTQAAAREKRYDFFFRTMEHFGYSVLITGHHADDQLETIIMQAASGRSLLGEEGIAPKRTMNGFEVARPLLGVKKKEILFYCREHGIPYVEDESNSTDDYRRNRVRRHVLPALKEEFPLVHQHMQKKYEWQKEQQNYMRRQARTSLDFYGERLERNYVSVKMDCFRETPLALQRETVSLLLNYYFSAEETGISASLVDACIDLASAAGSSGELHLPGGILIRKSYGRLEFLSREESGPSFPEPIRISDYGNYKYGAGIVGVNHARPEDTEVWIAVPERILSFPIYVRPPRAGDRIHIPGMKEAKKVHRLFIDEKVPKHERSFWPVFTDEKGTVLWIPRLRASFRYEKEAAYFVWKKD
ncbi:tRNA lysidine(34) synthetase TilS [Marinococcus sp. PL1-022]|uniref:tRNA lysidine(34) synthetase TilS n=1 Tax=Marinococcus sp. PL1-022 TaxID=3095363 RepID=UPI0029C42AA3|nr:tRNA lysidine(34) synthetase TilS [Marinococcus sp. PL1-022]MDX6154448.1 tRNA lysidine(34) synthetase TilS [Marinococcus sp. PL1-022]